MIADVTAWISVVGGVLGVAGVIAAGLVVVRSKIASATIDLLNENLSAQKLRIEHLETENALLRVRVSALEHTKDELFAQVKNLPAFTEMSASLMEVHKTLDAQIALLIKLVDE